MHLLCGSVGGSFIAGIVYDKLEWSVIELKREEKIVTSNEQQIFSVLSPRTSVLLFRTDSFV